MERVYDQVRIFLRCMENIMLLTQKQLGTFYRDGFILVEDLFDSKEMTVALTDMEQIFYGKSYVEYLEELDNIETTGSVEPTGIKAVAHFGDTEYGRAQFPTGFDALDRLIENEAYLDVFAQSLGTDDVSYCNAHLFMRSGPTDKLHPEHPWQGYHPDHSTNTFLPLSHAIGSFDYVNSAVYLHDVDGDGAPMHVIPGSHRQAADVILRKGMHWLDDIRQDPEFAEPVPTSA